MIDGKSKSRMQQVKGRTELIEFHLFVLHISHDVPSVQVLKFLI